MDIVIIVCAVLAVIIGVAVGFLVWGFNYACRGKKKGSVSETGEIELKGFGAEINAGAEWVRRARQH